MCTYFIFFICLYALTKSYQSRVLKWVLLFYIGASACALFLHYFVIDNLWTTRSVTYHCLILFLFLFPIIIFGKNENKISIILLDYNAFKILGTTFIILGIYSLIYFLIEDFHIIIAGNYGELRTEMIYNSSNKGVSIFRTIAGTAAYYYSFNLLLFFYSISFCKESKAFNLLLLISSFSRVFHALSYIGRDGIIFWIFSFIFFYSLFHSFLTKKIKSRLKRIFIFFGGIATLFLALISISRFEESEHGTFVGLIDYFGQGLNNFGQYFEKYDQVTGTKSIFPWLYGETGTRGVDAVKSTIDFYNKYGFNSNIFFTFVSTLYKAYGTFFSIIFALIYAFIGGISMNKTCFRMSSIIYLMFMVQIVIDNYFYFTYASRIGNLYMLTIPLFMVFCYFNSSTKVVKATQSTRPSLNLRRANAMRL